MTCRMNINESFDQYTLAKSRSLSLYPSLPFVNTICSFAMENLLGQTKPNGVYPIVGLVQPTSKSCAHCQGLVVSLSFISFRGLYKRGEGSFVQMIEIFIYVWCCREQLKDNISLLISHQFHQSI